MQDLVFHLVKPIVSNPDEVKVNMVEGEATVMLELSVHADDVSAVQGENGRTLRSIRNILSAAAGRRKATLDLVQEGAAAADEE